MTTDGIKGILKRSVASALVVLLVIPFISVPVAAEESETEYTMQVYTHVDFIRDKWDVFPLDTLRTKAGWFAEVNSLAKLAACTVGKQGSNVIFTREETGTAVYKIDAASVVKYNDQLYLPLETSTENLGIRFYNFRNKIAAEVLRRPEELKAELTNVFFDHEYPLSRMIVELGATWDAIEITSEVYAILPFVGDSNVISALLGTDAKKRYQEAFCELLSTKETLADIFLETGEMYDCFTDVMDTAEFMLLLVKENGKLAESLASSGLTEASLSDLIGDLSSGDIDIWRTEIDKVSAALNFDGLLKTVRCFDIAQDAEESLISAMQMVYANGNNLSAQKAANKIYTARFGTEAERVTSFISGWAEDSFVDILSKCIDKAITGGGIASLPAVVRTVTDYGLGASDKSNAVIYYALYASIQEDLKKAYFDLRIDGSNDIYAMRALALMYLKSGIAAFETMNFDKDLKTALENAKNMYADGMARLLSYSKQEIQPDYDNHCCVDWLEENYLTTMVPTYLKDYLGITVNELADIWGKDYVVLKELYLGGARGIYYKDGRINAVFYFDDPLGQGVKTGTEKINFIESSADCMVAERLPNNLTLSEVRELKPDFEYDDGKSSDIDPSCAIRLDSKTTATYYWNGADNPEAVKSSSVELYRSGLNAEIGWKEYYRDMLQQSANSADSTIRDYYVYDIDLDGTPELIERIGSCEAGTEMRISTVRNGQMYGLGNIWGVSLGGLNGSIFVYYAHTGLEAVITYYIDGAELVNGEEYVREITEESELLLLDAYPIDDYTGLNWHGNPSIGRNSEIISNW